MVLLPATIGASLLAWAIQEGATKTEYGAVLLGSAALLGCFVVWCCLRILRLKAEVVRVRQKLSTTALHQAAVVQFNEAQLPDKTTILEAALNHLSQGFAMILPDGKIWAYNRKAIEFSGIDEDQFTFPANARDIFKAQMAAGEFGEGGELAPPELREFLLKGVGRPPASYVRRRPNGTIIEVRSGLMPGGGTVQSYTDITELVHAKEAAEAAMKAKSEFLATMSHEIRTPLTGVVGMAELLSQAELPAPQRKYVDTLVECSDSLLTVVNDVLEFSRLESGAAELEQEPFNLRETCLSALDVAKATVGPKKLDFRFELRPPVAEYVLGDRARVRQVLLNLLGNAAKFTESGSVTLRLAVSAGARVRIEVEDTGIGIPVSAGHRVFTEFSQVDSSISRRFGGTGLGLAISKKLIENMGGEIGFESQEGEGTVFWLEVPLAASAKPAGSIGPVTLKHNRALRVLLAEDGRVNQMVATQILRTLGHTADVAHDGAEAVAMVQMQAYNLILMDIQMPQMSGIDATKAIRALGASYATIPIVALTANASAVDRAACAEAGMTEFLSKPFKSAELAKVLERIGDAPFASKPGAALDPRDEARLIQLLTYVGSKGLKDVLGSLESEAIALLHQLDIATAAGDQQGYRELVASLGEVFSSGGFPSLAEHCQTVLATASCSRKDEIVDLHAATVDMLYAALAGAAATISAELPVRNHKLSECA
jgi:signal transduction histidine kinase/FixJ family two-component response regulator